MFKKYKSIDSFSSVWKHLNRCFYKYGSDAITKLTYRGKPKLHGTNAGIRFEDGLVIGQKRSTDLKEGDNFGFKEWLLEQEVNIPNSNMVIFGEWAGPGIQKTDAVSMIPEKMFFIFQIFDIDGLRYISCPKQIKEISNSIFGDNKRIKVLPWVTDDIEVDLNGDVNLAIDEFNKPVELMEIEDFYIKEEFGISSPGEGIVYYPIFANVTKYDLSDYMFKAKTKHHAVKKQNKPVSKKTSIPASVIEFVDKFLTEARMEQGAFEVRSEDDPDYDLPLMGKFLQWISKDVHKESQLERKENPELDWKKINKHLVHKARLWYHNKSRIL